MDKRMKRGAIRILERGEAQCLKKHSKVSFYSNARESENCTFVNEVAHEIIQLGISL